MHYRFVARHPGVFMYHCATQPVLMHTGAGMVGMFVVKPKGLAPVDRELWMTQQEYYLGKPGGDRRHGQDAGQEARRDRVQRLRQPVQGRARSPSSKRRADPDVRPQRRPEHLERVPRHRHRLRPDRHRGRRGHDAQTINLAPSQGGWVEFTLAEEGTYPFVTHAFGDMVKGALGVLATPHAPPARRPWASAGAAPGITAAGAPTTAKAAGPADVNVTMGDMWIKADHPTVKAGTVTFDVKNAGAMATGWR